MSINLHRHRDSSLIVFDFKYFKIEFQIDFQNASFRCENSRNRDIWNRLWNREPRIPTLAVRVYYCVMRTAVFFFLTHAQIYSSKKTKPLYLTGVHA